MYVYIYMIIIYPCGGHETAESGSRLTAELDIVSGHRAWSRGGGIAHCDEVHDKAYRGTSLVRKRTPLGPYCRLVLRVLGGS